MEDECEVLPQGGGPSWEGCARRQGGWVRVGRYGGEEGPEGCQATSAAVAYADGPSGPRRANEGREDIRGEGFSLSAKGDGVCGAKDDVIQKVRAFGGGAAVEFS